ncbi:MAG: hypothetical protein LC649_02410 [Bacteroidales bacterium]|nr:hypothetical protein [Bacteroidales bacterium]
MRKYSCLIFSVVLLILHFTPSHSQDLTTISKQEPIKINGSVNVRLQFYDSDKTNPSRSPFMWYLQGSPVVTLYGIVLPFSFRVSEQQRDFRQPFNQFGVSPYYKWVKLHLGYRSHTWSTYSLAGHSISGAGVELTPGKFQFGVVTGRLLKPVKYLDNPEHIQVQTPAYKRTGTALRLGYGTDRNNISFVVLKAADDQESLNEIPLEYQLTPDENMVVSFISKQTIAEKFLLELEVAQSLYTKDIRTPLSDSTGAFLSKAFSFLMESHESTTSSNAFKGSLGYRSDMFSLAMRYERVEPDFRSMGAYYFATDLSNITIEPSLKLLKNRLNLGGSVGIQTDNLKNDKNLRTKRTITSARLSYVPFPQYNISAFYSNYGLAQESGLLAIDTLRNSEVAQATLQFGLTQSLNLTGEKMTHNLMASFNAQQLNDRNENTAQYSEFSTNILSVSYFASYMPTGTNASLTWLYTDFVQDTLRTVVAGPSIGAGNSFFKNRLTAGISFSSMKNKVQDKETGTINTFSLQLGYKPGKNHRFALRLYHHKNTGKSTVYSSYYENKFDIDYTYSF